MKTKKEFEKIAGDFYNAIYGKVGDAFFDAVTQFAEKHQFYNTVIGCLYRSDEDQVLFITDHPANEVGIVFVEVFDKKAFFFVDSKAGAKRFIQLHDMVVESFYGKKS